jgi:hypothetical protein
MNFKNCNFLFLIIIILAFQFTGFELAAKQDSDSTKSEKSKDKSFWDDNENWISMDDMDWIFGKSTQFEIKEDRPTLEFFWDFDKASINHDDFSGNLGKVNSGELYLGWTTIKKSIARSSILKYKCNYFFIGNLSTKLASNINNDLATTPLSDIQSDAWRFGCAKSSGYGYILSKTFNITFFNTKGFGWTRLTFDNKNKVFPGATASDTANLNQLDLYNKSFRFGDVHSGGIKFQVYEPFGITVAYERSIVYPRHMFWYWAGSELIEAIGHGLIGEFSHEVMKASPYAGPIVDFLLQNGLSYGITELRKKDMNWPFNTASPFVYDGFKVGLSFVF